MPQLLADALKPNLQLVTNPLHHPNTYVTVEIIDENRRACVIKGKIVVESR